MDRKGPDDRQIIGSKAIDEKDLLELYFEQKNSPSIYYIHLNTHTYYVINETPRQTTIYERKSFQSAD